MGIRLRVLPALLPLNVELQNTGTEIQWRLTGGEWQTLITLTELSITPEQLLASLITVDGTGSGLDADLLDGAHASAFYQTGGTDVPIVDGGTGASTAADARTNLGLVIGTDIQAQDAELAAIAGLTSAADRVPYFTGSGTAALATFTAAGRALVDDADATAQRVTLGLVIGTNVQAQDAELSAIAGLVSAADKIPYFSGSGTAALADFPSSARTAFTAGFSANVLALLDDANFSAMRTSLGLAIGTDVQAFDADLTTWAGITPATGVGTFLATPSSVNLKAAVTDETGSGALVFATSPTLVTPTVTTSLLPTTDDGAALGSTTFRFSDLFLASGAAINFANSDVKITHNTDALLFENAASGYLFDGAVRPTTNDAAALGVSGAAWSDAFFATGAVFDFGAGNWIATHSSGILTVGTGEVRITTPGTNTASVATVGGTQTFINKTFDTAGTGNVFKVNGTTISADVSALLDDANFAAMRTSLGLAIGTDVQAQDAQLAALAGLSPANGDFTRWTSSTAAVTQAILGTVAQSGGVPTGAIFETGSGANGVYIKFADGTMICWNLNLTGSGTTTLNTTLFIGDATWTFPATFAAAPAVFASNLSTSRWSNARASSTTTATIRAWSDSNSATVTNHFCAAIGKWF